MVPPADLFKSPLGGSQGQGGHICLLGVGAGAHLPLSSSALRLHPRGRSLHPPTEDADSCVDELLSAVCLLAHLLSSIQAPSQCTEACLSRLVSWPVLPTRPRAQESQDIVKTVARLAWELVLTVTRIRVAFSCLEVPGKAQRPRKPVLFPRGSPRRGPATFSLYISLLPGILG